MNKGILRKNYTECQDGDFFVATDEPRNKSFGGNFETYLPGPGGDALLFILEELYVTPEDSIMIWRRSAEHTAMH